MLGERVFQQTVDIPMGTNCAPLLTNLIRCSWEAYFIQGLLKKNERNIALSFNFTFRYIDDVLLLNNSRFGDFIDLIYPIELKIKDATDTYGSASYLEINIEIENEGRLRTTLLQWTIYYYLANNILLRHSSHELFLNFIFIKEMKDYTRWHHNIYTHYV